MKEILMTLLALAAGVFCIWGAAADKDFFFENRRARGVVRLFGRTGARVFYIVLGVLVCLSSLALLFLH